MKLAIRFFCVIVTMASTLFIVDGAATQPRHQGAKKRVSVPGAHPFDEVNIFGDWGRSDRLPNHFENKLWWERIVRGEVGQDRFLIICALKDGTWGKLGDIRDYVEFQIRESYAVPKLRKLLTLMLGRPNVLHGNKYPKKPQIGEGWLEKNREANYKGISSEWRIEPSVLPLLYFLLMACPEDNLCR